MKGINDIVLNAIKDAIVTVPGVVSFYDFKSNKKDQFQTDDLEAAIELINNDNSTRIKIHIIILNDVNIKDVIKEVQIRVKYELEKMSKFTEKYMVDVVVDDLA